MGAIPAIKERLLGWYYPNTFKTDRLICVNGQTNIARLPRLVMLIKNIFTLWGRKRTLHCDVSS